VAIAKMIHVFLIVKFIIIITSIKLPGCNVAQVQPVSKSMASKRRESPIAVAQARKKYLPPILAPGAVSTVF
jgi:hypothetical protein